MRIAQIAPLHESVPPALYGGTERVVSYLTEELVRQGHDVTLFATADSRTAARLEPCRRRALRLDTSPSDPSISHATMMERVAARARQFDVLHFHTESMHFPVARRVSRPCLTTLHGRLDLPDIPELLGEFAEMPLVSISDAQRDPVPWAHWVSTIYHGLPRDLYRFSNHPREHLAFIGRISREKRPDLAIRIARRARLPLKIAAKVADADRAYFDREIRPLLARGNGVEFIGEVDEAGKQRLLERAIALLFPIDWPEPFGLVMIEAMACGAPVIAMERGSVPEIIRDGVSGCIVRSEDEAVRAVQAAQGLSPAACRHEFEARFTAERMARDYVRVYERLAPAAGRAARASPADRGWIEPAPPAVSWRGRGDGARGREGVPNRSFRGWGPPA